MSFNVLHPLPMLIREPVEPIISGTTGQDTLLQSLEQLIGLIELDRD